MVGQMFGFYLYTNLWPTRKRRNGSPNTCADCGLHHCGGYVLRDIDGKATRWGVWAPASINEDPDWRVEGVNKTFEVLSFLKARTT